jgi:hypothetical protein
MVVFLPFLMASGPCDDGPASPTADGGAGASAAGTTGASGTTGGSGNPGAGTTGAAGAGSSCEDRFEPIGRTVERFQGSWLIDSTVATGPCGGKLIVTFEPWTLSAAFPDDPTPTPGCRGVFMVVTRKVLPEECDASDNCPGECDVTFPCPTANSAQGFFVEPYPKNPSAYGPGPKAELLVKTGPGAPWMRTNSYVLIDKQDPTKLNFTDIPYTQTLIRAGVCTGP